ncbi:RNA polymerase sigma factor [Streptosporangium saharense]|uniref:RNA polymerase sigma factor n=1 Tax=Streptosporangium saharense TaxID=1706840 RepID=UPI003333F85D
MTERDVARPEDTRSEDRPDGFGEFYRLTSARMLTRATMICASRQDAEDAVADAYLEAFRHWDRIGGYEPRAAERWVHTTMQRRWWKIAGRRRRREAQELRVPVRPCSTPEETAEVSMVLSALGSLAERERIVVLAHCVYGMSHKEIAERLGIRSSLVALVLFQARRRLERLTGLGGRNRGPGQRFARLSGLLGADTPAQADDPLAVLLHGAWEWLSEAFEAQGTALDRVRGVIEAARDRSGGRP